MKARERIDAEIEHLRDDPDYEFEVLLLDINSQLTALMAASGIRKVDIAERLGVSRAFVTNLLRGEANITLKTCVRLANALDAKFGVDIRPKDVRRTHRWSEALPSALPTTADPGRLLSIAA